MNKKKEKAMAGDELVASIVASLDEAKAQKINVINLKNLPSATDWFIVCESDNSAHIRACAHHVIKDLSLRYTRPWHQEGLEDGRWVLLDYSDVVVHIMLNNLRNFYNLEELWAEGTLKKIGKSWIDPTS